MSANSFYGAVNTCVRWQLPTLTDDQRKAYVHNVHAAIYDVATLVTLVSGAVFATHLLLGGFLSIGAIAWSAVGYFTRKGIEQTLASQEANTDRRGMRLVKRLNGLPDNIDTNSFFSIAGIKVLLIPFLVR